MDRDERVADDRARRRGRRPVSAAFFAIALVATLLVPTVPATADHGTVADCDRPGDAHADPPHYCVPDGSWGVTMYQPYKRHCRYDGTITWGDGASETQTDWMDLSTSYHQYTSHGVFTVVFDFAGRGGIDADGDECTDVYTTHTVEVPVPNDEGRISSSTFPLTTRIEKAKRQLQSQIDPLIATHEQIEEELVLRQRALDNQIELHAFRLANVETIEAQLSELRVAIADGIGSEDSEEMTRLKRFLRDAQLEEFAQRLVLKNKEREFQNLLVRRDGVRRQLLVLSEPLEALDFELLGLAVDADSVPVYKVDLTSPYGRLAQLNREIGALREILPELAIQKKEAIDNFAAVHEAASRQLREIATLIWHNALIKGAVDLGTNAVDILIAGSKGGLAGAGVEAASKLYEGYLKGKLSSEPIGDPNPGTEAIDAWFEQSAVETVGESAKALGIERGIKETAVKLAKDYLTEELGELFPKLQGGTPSESAAPGQTSHQERRSRGFLKRLKDLGPKLKNERLFRTDFKEWFRSSLGRKLVIDAGKAVLNRTLQGEEMAAWRDYTMLDTQAQGLFSLWQAAANAFWETSDQIDAREKEKAQLLLGFNPDTGQTIRVQESFKNPLTLEVRLVVPRSARPFENVPIQVWIGGVQMARIGPRRFHIGFYRLPESVRSALVVEVR